MLGPEVFAASLPELDSDDVVTLAEELEPEELDDALAALPARDRVLVEQSLSYPKISRPFDAARNGGRAAFLDGWPDDRFFALNRRGEQ